MSELIVSALQMACNGTSSEIISRAERLIAAAAMAGARLIVLPELFEGPYFCKDLSESNLEQAAPLLGHPIITRMQSLAASLQVVLPVSFFEKSGPVSFNSLAIIDADGAIVGIYRKSHIPDGHGYHEKFYFSPGDTGFRVFTTRAGRIGCGICWDQWFPEAARIMMLGGAEILLYPTAIGSEPQDPGLDSRDHWTRVMQGHAAANLVPVVAANRVGLERGQSCDITFYGSSFIAGPTGELLAQAGRDEEAIVTARLDLAAIARRRSAWGVFRDRRPDLYGPLLSLDGGGFGR